ncbi:MAG: hypothetical protein FD136_214 [Chitinophagaceae bacterium]|nr:MAG: hypothetical protein FD183_1045 [Chitinophagaceae bacterium]TXT34581.1 MAG: hypothetical protein FD136_214 [Chitinophagaceae bacterium]
MRWIESFDYVKFKKNVREHWQKNPLLPHILKSFLTLITTSPSSHIFSQSPLLFQNQAQLH